MPLFHVGFDISAVVAAEGPELYHHHLALQVRQMQGRAVQLGFVHNIWRLHVDSRIDDGPGDEHPGQESTDANQNSPYHDPLLLPVLLHPTVLGQSWIYLAIEIAGVEYFVKSVTVIWNRFDRTAKAS